MKKILLIIVLVIAIATIYCLFKYHNNTKTTQIFHIEDMTPYQKSRIAHAGGALEGYTYSNCYDVIKYYYDKGVRLFELDIEYTSDNVPIMLHSWDGFQYKYFGIDRDKICTFEEFENATMINGWTKLTLDSTIYLMKTEFPEMILITDTKENNDNLLLTLSTKYVDMMERIVPQVYNQEEYNYAKKLGFKNIIYTLYMSEDTDDEIIDFCIESKPFAITMPKARAIDTPLAKRLYDIGIYVYAHTINENTEYEDLKQNGIKGIYTDTLF